MPSGCGFFEAKNRPPCPTTTCHARITPTSSGDKQSWTGCERCSLRKIAPGRSPSPASAASGRAPWRWRLRTNSAKCTSSCPEARFQAIVWISAKEEELSIQGEQKANLPPAILRTLEDLYNVVARVLEREDITRALPQEQGFIVQKALQEQRTLLVMDNLESVTDERIKPFLRNLPAPTKALITSREWLNVAEILTLKGFKSGRSRCLYSR